jgi:uncharacterized protein
VKIVVDTNVFIASVIQPASVARQVMSAIERRTVQLILSKPLIHEIGQVLHKPSLVRVHQMNDREISHYLKLISVSAEIVAGQTAVEVSADPVDNMLFATALEAGAAYIVSEDTRHVLPVREYQGVKTISPRAFIDMLKAEVKKTA